LDWRDYRKHVQFFLVLHGWVAEATEEDFSNRVVSPADAVFDEMSAIVGETNQRTPSGQRAETPPRLRELGLVLVNTAQIFMNRRVIQLLTPYVERTDTVRRSGTGATGAQSLVVVAFDELELGNLVAREVREKFKKGTGLDFLGGVLRTRPSTLRPLVDELVEVVVDERSRGELAKKIVKVAPRARQKYEEQSKKILPLFQMVLMEPVERDAMFKSARHGADSQNQ
jgi:hypothetical protein